jgi:hypothetical protein
MSNDEDFDQLFRDTLAQVTEASAAVARSSGNRRRGLFLRKRAAPNRWLASPTTLLLFRKREHARRANEYGEKCGYQTTVFERYLLIEAPWLFLATLVAVAGLDAEVVAIHWELVTPVDYDTF